MMRYAVVIERAEGNYSAYVPDLPGCVATGPTIADVEQEIGKPSASMWRAFRPTVCQFRSLPAWLEYVEA